MRRAKLSAAALARLEHDVRNTYLTFRALGKKYGVSGQRVQQISQRWKIDAHARWVNRREARHREREHQFEIGHYPAPTQGFVRRAARAGLTLQPLVSYGSDGYVSHVSNDGSEGQRACVPFALVGGAELQIPTHLRWDDFLLHFSC